MKKLTLSFYATCLSLSLIAQVGCTDPLANNYNQNAIENDGSCTYEATNYTPEFKTSLGNKLEEISGMLLYNGRYFGLADSGNPNKIYEFNPSTGSILKSFKLKGTVNNDWESMTSDDHFIYVGDTGNNKNGNRKNLVIYKFPKSDLDTPGDIPSNHIQRLYYHYEDQTDFSKQPKFSTRYDCESITAIGDSIYLFSKDWLQYKTRYYTIPKVPTGDYAANLKDSLSVLGLVTDVSSIGDSIVVLLGSSLTGSDFLQLLFNFKDHQLFSGNTRQIFINHEQMAQPEGLIIQSNFDGYIGSEYNNGIDQSFLKINIENWVKNPLLSIINSKTTNQLLSVFPNPIKSGSLHIEVPPQLRNQTIQLYWLDATGRQLSKKTVSNRNQVEIKKPKAAKPGLHYILMQVGEVQMVGKVTVTK